jgi:hypothetical protein
MKTCHRFKVRNIYSYWAKFYLQKLRMTMRKKIERESEHESGVESEAMSEMDSESYCEQS